MQCPECGHTPTASDPVDPTRCPECGIYYHKALQARVQQLEEEKLQAASTPVRVTAPTATQQQRNVQAVVSKYPGAQPVVVMDVNMSFGSMVLFMIKWGIASIPALIILGAIYVFGMTFFLGFLGAAFSR
ncbi:hypothetical protein JVX91_27985 [Pseudomonas sp. PDNC002]|uniref:hypothetical protein n=1 Tax=Pseudomonas sp. PDNC002 TaxID=2811422 RepID=UPI0019633770|nr:hypothetical protein [Pseudomonas sp. PDNC002]QRY79359.1 hypothetical protein JVX91_27985 [Pseudomonas sp. PDNC002]